jgi:hypothetical protein
VRWRALALNATLSRAIEGAARGSVDRGLAQVVQAPSAGTTRQPRRSVELPLEQALLSWQPKRSTARVSSSAFDDRLVGETHTSRAAR